MLCPLALPDRPVLGAVSGAARTRRLPAARPADPGRCVGCEKTILRILLACVRAHVFLLVLLV